MPRLDMRLAAAIPPPPLAARLTCWRPPMIKWSRTRMPRSARACFRLRVRPLQFNFSKGGVGVPAGIKDFRVGLAREATTCTWVPAASITGPPFLQGPHALLQSKKSRLSAASRGGKSRHFVRSAPPAGLEPATHGLPDTYSIQLSYRGRSRIAARQMIGKHYR